MKTVRKASQITREKLLKTAIDVFAEKGFRDATVAEISERSGVNIAGVNYHFGDKETLYREAWRYAFSESIKNHPPDGGVDEKASAEDRFKGQVRALINRISDRNNKEFMITLRELTNPTGLLNEIMQEMMIPLQSRMHRTIKELVGNDCPEEVVMYCEISVISQCINPMVFGIVSYEVHPPRIKDIKSYTEHVIEFSLAGINKIRDRFKKE
ncbi:MAG: CerR family C-terminal domain-containing protein [Thermodesulfovibrionales bacterium]|nr:CerR family C-terminal domain-containing protein [Thermodesulfovibrionales bacterium]